MSSASTRAPMPHAASASAPCAATITVSSPTAKGPMAFVTEAGTATRATVSQDAHIRRMLKPLRPSSEVCLRYCLEISIKQSCPDLS